MLEYFWVSEVFKRLLLRLIVTKWRLFLELPLQLKTVLTLTLSGQALVLATYLQACVRDNGSWTRLQYRHPKLWASEQQNAQSSLNWVVVCEHFKNRNTNRLACILLIEVGCYKAEGNLEISILSLRRHYKSFSFLISEEQNYPGIWQSFDDLGACQLELN